MSSEIEIWRLRSRRRRLNERLREEFDRSVPDPLAILALRRRERSAAHELLVAEAAPA